MNKVFIATSIDVFIADKNGGIEWLHSVPNPDQNDMGYTEFMSGIDALVMGRNTFETVCSFDMEWPYTKPVYVLSNSLDRIPAEFSGKAQLVNGKLKNVLELIRSAGHHDLYIDGGRTIQNFLKEDLIDEMIITVIPVLLGGGVPLFGETPEPLNFECVEVKHYLERVGQCRYVRKRK